MAGVEIRILVEALSPPVGRVGRTEGDLARFSGWLGLLSLLSELIEPDPIRPGGLPSRPARPERTGPAS